MSLIEDITLATVVVRSLEEAVEGYRRYFGYEGRESGRLEAGYAEALGAAALSGARFVVVGSPDGSPGAVRFIEDPATEPVPPLTTYGWSALEITVRDCDGLCAALQTEGSPFKHYAGPADLVFQEGPPGQRAFQATGPNGELLYLTQILRQNPQYSLPVPGEGAEVGRLFIMVLNTPDYAATMSFYTEVLGMPKSIEVSLPLRLVNRALDLPPATAHMLATVQTAATTLIEIDGYSVPAQPRPVAPGYLPSQAALLTMSATGPNFEQLVERLQAAGTPLRFYETSASRSVILTAPGGELIELIRSW